MHDESLTVRRCSRRPGPEPRALLERAPGDRDQFTGVRNGGRRRAARGGTASITGGGRRERRRRADGTRNTRRRPGDRESRRKCDGPRSNGRGPCPLRLLSRPSAAQPTADEMGGADPRTKLRPGKFSAENFRGSRASRGPRRSSRGHRGGRRRKRGGSAASLDRVRGQTARYSIARLRRTDGVAAAAPARVPA